MLSIGIVGLPNVGKSTLFNALTRSKQADAQNYAFCTIEPNVGIVEVPDKRLEKLSKVSSAKKIIPTTIKFVDIAGLVEGAHKGEGLGNKFLQHIREVDAIAHVVRDFSDTNVMHVHEDHAATKDATIINEELILADWQMVQKKLEQLQKQMKGKVDKDIKKQQEVFQKIYDHLESGQPVRSLELLDEELDSITELPLLTAKPMMYIINTDEESVIMEGAVQMGSEPHVRICAKLEAELAELSPDEAKAYLAELDIEHTGLDKIILVGYRLLSLITFFTSGEQETRAWTVKSGATAPEAAGEIHTDFIKGFIKADVVNTEDFIEAGGWSRIKETGKMRLEGKDYQVQDGDVVFFHVNT